MSTLQHINKNLSTQLPTILTLFYNEGEIDYSTVNPSELINVSTLIKEKNPDILFIGNQESLVDLNFSFVQQISNLITNEYTIVKTVLGGQKGLTSSVLSVVSLGTGVFKSFKKNKNIRSTLFLNNKFIDYFGKINNKFKIENSNKIGYSCNLQKITSKTAYKDAILFIFEYNSMKYCIVNSHLSYSDKTSDQDYKKRSEQLICLLNQISKYVDSHNIIFGGDLNFRLLPKKYVLTNKLNKLTPGDIKFLVDLDIKFIKELYNQSLNNINNYSRVGLSTPSIKFIQSVPMDIIEYLHSNEYKNKNKNENKNKKTIENFLTSESVKNFNKNFIISNNLKKSTNNKIFNYNELSILFSKNPETNAQFMKLINAFKNSLKNHPFYITCRYKEGSENIETTKGKHNNNNNNNNQQRTRAQSNGAIGLTTIPESNNQERVRSQSNSAILQTQGPKSIYSIFKKEKKETYRIPSMCDRILYSFLIESTIKSTIKPKIYPLNRSKLKYSDHLMLCGEFYM